MSQNQISPVEKNQININKTKKEENFIKTNRIKQLDLDRNNEIEIFKKSFLINSDSSLKPKIYSKNFLNKGLYTGELTKEGIRHGIGMFSFKQNDDVYCGEWENDIFHGSGTYYYSSGDKYEGEIFKGMKEGNGRYYFKNGNFYEGDWKNNLKDGQGKMEYKTRNEVYDGWFYFFIVLFILKL